MYCGAKIVANVRQGILVTSTHKYQPVGKLPYSHMVAFNQSIAKYNSVSMIACIKVYSMDIAGLK